MSRFVTKGRLCLSTAAPAPYEEIHQVAAAGFKCGMSWSPKRDAEPLAEIWESALNAGIASTGRNPTLSPETLSHVRTLPPAPFSSFVDVSFWLNCAAKTCSAKIGSCTMCDMSRHSGGMLRHRMDFSKNLNGFLVQGDRLQCHGCSMVAHPRCLSKWFNQVKIYRVLVCTNCNNATVYLTGRWPIE